MVRTRKPAQKVALPVVRKAKGGVVLGKNMLRHKKQTDVQKQDPRLLEETQVKLTRDPRLERLGAQKAYARGSQQRKKQPVLKPPARGRLRSVTIYKSKKPLATVSTRRSSIRGKRSTSNKSVVALQSGANDVTGRKTRGSLSKKVLTPKKVTKKKVSVSKKISTPKRASARAKKVVEPKKSSSLRQKGQAKGRKRTLKREKGNSPKKLKFQIPQHQVLLNLIQNFEIRLKRNEHIEELVAFLKTQEEKKQEESKKKIQEFSEVQAASTEVSSVEADVDVLQNSVGKMTSTTESVEVEGLMGECNVDNSVVDDNDTQMDESENTMDDKEDDSPEEDPVEEGSAEDVPVELVEVGDELEVVEDEVVTEAYEEENPATNEEEGNGDDTTVLINDEVDEEYEEETEPDHAIQDDQDAKGSEEIGMNGIMASANEKDEADDLDLEEDMFEDTMDTVVEEIPINYGNQIRNALAASEAKKISK